MLQENTARKIMFHMPSVILYSSPKYTVNIHLCINAIYIYIYIYQQLDYKGSSECEVSSRGDTIKEAPRTGEKCSAFQGYMRSVANNTDYPFFALARPCHFWSFSFLAPKKLPPRELYETPEAAAAASRCKRMHAIFARPMTPYIPNAVCEGISSNGK